MAEERKAKICVIGEARFLEPLVNPKVPSSDHKFTVGVGFYNYEGEEEGVKYLPSTDIFNSYAAVSPYFSDHMSKIAKADVIIFAVAADQTTQVIKILERVGFNGFTSEKGSVLIRGEIDREAKDILRRLVGEEKILFSLSEGEIQKLFQAARQSYGEFEKKRQEILDLNQELDEPIGQGIAQEAPKPKSNNMRFFASSSVAFTAAVGVGALAFSGVLTSPLLIITLTALSLVAAIVFLVLAYRESRIVQKQDKEMRSLV